MDVFNTLDNPICVLRNSGSDKCGLRLRKNEKSRIVTIPIQTSVNVSAKVDESEFPFQNPSSGETTPNNSPCSSTSFVS